MLAAQPVLEKLLTLLTHSPRGVIAIALYDKLTVRREVAAALRQRLTAPVHELTLNQAERNPIDLIRALKPATGAVVNLFDLEQAFPDALGYLDLQRETLVESEVSLVCWVNTYEHRELATRAPNFYAFRTAVFDFTTNETLPPTQQRLVGRSRELAEVRQWLTQKRSVAVTGLGGVGKTRLARELAQQMREQFPGGVLWLNCATRPALSEIVLQVATSLLGEAARHYLPDEQRQRALDFLRARACLLILDNFETVADDTEVLRWLGEITPPSALLLTTRQGVPALKLTRLELPELTPAAAAELFQERARVAGWQGPDKPEQINRLCELAGHLPLAIELLAARAAELPLATLAELVAKDLRALETAGATAARANSVAASIRFSFDRLSETARQVLMRLSLLPDGASPLLIPVITKIEHWHEPVAECVRHSLLRFEGERYSLHPLVSRFAFAELGAAATAWQRHFINSYVDWARAHQDIENHANHALLDAEWRNTCAAAATAVTLQDWQAVRSLSISLNDFLLLRGLLTEREQLNQRALAAARALNDPFAEGEALNNLGCVYERQDRLAEAEPLYQRSLEIMRAFSHPYNEAIALNNLGVIARKQERLTEAKDFYWKSLKIRNRLKDFAGQAQTLSNLGNLYAQQERFKEALAAYKKSLTITQKHALPIQEATTLLNLAHIYITLGEFDKAQQAAQQSIRLCRKYGNQLIESRGLKNLALLRLAQNDLPGALAFTREAQQRLEASQYEAEKAELAAFQQALEHEATAPSTP